MGTELGHSASVCLRLKTVEGKFSLQIHISQFSLYNNNLTSWCFKRGICQEKAAEYIIK
jgi:hypothetical protein